MLIHLFSQFRWIYCAYESIRCLDLEIWHYCAYESIRCLDLEIWQFRAHDNRRQTKPIALLVHACGVTNKLKHLHSILQTLNTRLPSSNHITKFPFCAVFWSVRTCFRHHSHFHSIFDTSTTTSPAKSCSK